MELTMKVLVTGHNGYVGTIMAPMLLAAGHDVVGIDSNLYLGSTFGNENGSHAIPAQQKDIRDIEAADLEGVEGIIHLAGLSNDPLGDLNPELTFDINYRGSVRLAELARELGVRRFIFSSSCSNYGAGGQDWLDEESDFNPVTPYGRSKVMVEQELAKMAGDAFCVAMLRSGTAYGVSPRLRFDLVLNNLTAWAFTTGCVFLKSDGMAWRPMVHIEDMSRAFLAVLHAPAEQVNNQAFNVGRSEENYRIRELAEIVAETVPGSRIEYAEGAEPDKRCYRVDSGKIARTLPEFQPQWDARRGAQELYQAYQRVGLAVDEFEGPRYRRVDRIKELLRHGRLDETLRWRKEGDR
jgi:nucleoside-diphosphate-sugar epimerase